MFPPIESVFSDFYAGGILTLLLYLVGKWTPIARRCLASQWGRARPRLAADYGAARSASLWRKAFATVAIPAVVLGFAAYAVTSAVYGAPPLWAQAWLGGVVVAGVLGCAAREGWLTGRWAVRRARRLLA